MTKSLFCFYCRKIISKQNIRIRIINVQKCDKCSRRRESSIWKLQSKEKKLDFRWWWEGGGDGGGVYVLQL